MESQTKPGPGWWRGKRGSSVWWPHRYTNADFRVVDVVAAVFIILAVFTLIGGGAIAAEEWVNLHHDGDSGNTITVVLASTISGAILSACFLAFLGFVLQLLRTIHFDIRLSEIGEAERT